MFLVFLIGRELSLLTGGQAIERGIDHSEGGRGNDGPQKGDLTLFLRGWQEGSEGHAVSYICGCRGRKLRKFTPDIFSFLRSRKQVNCQNWW